MKHAPAITPIAPLGTTARIASKTLLAFLLAPLLALFNRRVARMLQELETLFALWKSGNLPLPAPVPARRPTLKPARAPHRRARSHRRARATSRIAPPRRQCAAGRPQIQTPIFPATPPRARAAWHKRE